MARRISFWARKPVKKKVDVCFKTTSGKRVCFKATKKVPKRVRVSFRVRK